MLQWNGTEWDGSQWVPSSELKSANFLSSLGWSSRDGKVYIQPLQAVARRHQPPSLFLDQMVTISYVIYPFALFGTILTPTSSLGDFKIRWQQLSLPEREETNCSCHHWESDHLYVFFPFLLSLTDWFPLQDRQDAIVPFISSSSFVLFLPSPKGLQSSPCVTKTDTLWLVAHTFSTDFLSPFSWQSSVHIA